jgi:hypothetical protein
MKRYRNADRHTDEQQQQQQQQQQQTVSGTI